jgi:hypothetical protein
MAAFEFDEKVDWGHELGWPSCGAEEIRQQKGRFYDGDCIGERDESAAMEEAASDLLRLNRYERRAWSRQRRAIFAFMNLKLMKQYKPDDPPGK